MNKWVCVTKDWGSFTYGKIYEGELNGSLLDVCDDTGYRSHPCLHGSREIIPMMNTRYYGPPTEKVYYFIPLDEWRDKQIDEIIR